jgi:stage III sporulation protein AH
MKVFKRNAVIITVLLFVCAAVYLNWAYGRQQGDNQVSTGTGDTQQTSTAEGDGDALDESAGLYYEDDADTTTTDGTLSQTDMAGYFDQVRLNRKQARDEATQTLSTISETEGASQEAIDAALAQMMQLADWSTQEAELESLITAKGFEDCVVYIAEDGVTVTVSVDAEGLSTAGAAKITDLITSETDYTASDITIIEIK